MPRSIDREQKLRVLSKGLSKPKCAVKSCREQGIVLGTCSRLVLQGLYPLITCSLAGRVVKDRHRGQEVMPRVMGTIKK